MNPRLLGTLDPNLRLPFQVESLGATFSFNKDMGMGILEGFWSECGSCAACIAANICFRIGFDDTQEFRADAPTGLAYDESSFVETIGIITTI